MGRKSFLRGFGTGVLFAAAILGISFSIRTSESATITRAKKLGMVFENNNQKVLEVTKAPEKTPQPEASETPGATEVPENTGKPGNTNSPEKSKEPGQTKVPESKESEKPASTKTTKVPEASKKPLDKDISKQFEDEKNKLKKDIEDKKKQLTINDGDWAGKVSKELEDMGIIDDAVAFDKYLTDNGYSNVINSGTYDVSPDDTYHDLAEKITSRFK